MTSSASISSYNWTEISLFSAMIIAQGLILQNLKYASRGYTPFPQSRTGQIFSYKSYFFDPK